jgi:HEPN domain-containing protein
MNREQWLDSLALNFRNIADGDYVAARLASRAQLLTQFLWASHQAVEKYLKCVLLLNRVEAGDVKHNLATALDKLASAQDIQVDLMRPTREFIKKLNHTGVDRYGDISKWSKGPDLCSLDQAVWEVRRYCTKDLSQHRLALTDGETAPRMRLPGGELEKILAKRSHPAREPLLWQNSYFGRKRKRRVKPGGWVAAGNSRFSLNPEWVEDAAHYVYIPLSEKSIGIWRSRSPLDADLWTEGEKGSREKGSTPISTH